MRKNFKWGGYYQENECLDSYDKELDKKQTVCYIEGKWRVFND